MEACIFSTPTLSVWQSSDHRLRIVNTRNNGAIYLSRVERDGLATALVPSVRNLPPRNLSERILALTPEELMAAMEKLDSAQMAALKEGLVSLLAARQMEAVRNRGIDSHRLTARRFFKDMNRLP